MITRLLSRRYERAEPFSVRTEDGVPLVGSRLGSGPAALVLCHGFMGWHRKASIVAFAEELAAWFRVYAFDTRGHGRSGGSSTYGDREYLDVEAVVALARREAEAPVATMGASMGGSAVLRHAAYRGGVGAVMAISAPARWMGHETDAMKRLSRITGTRLGRGTMRVLGYRLSPEWDAPEEPYEVVGKIAPIPLLIVHGKDDHYFAEEEARLLYREAREPKRLMLATSFGHAEDGFTPAFARLASRRLYEALDLPWRG